ncbi:Hypothetical_protein [Hexamita inflata]|uniref:Hypothetical_protein n=1 Tax=Hexamita inflata TaxID=28002 RepID=A0AA86QRY8_9EUKA|nr:Hypothetical protein HINF_LOCUS45789 [Hexamita inflata]
MEFPSLRNFKASRNPTASSSLKTSYNNSNSVHSSKTASKLGSLPHFSEPSQFVSTPPSIRGSGMRQFNTVNRDLEEIDRKCVGKLKFQLKQQREFVQNLTKLAGKLDRKLEKSFQGLESIRRFQEKMK